MGFAERLIEKIQELWDSRPLHYGRDFTVEPLRIGRKKEQANQEKGAEKSG